MSYLHPAPWHRPLRCSTTPRLNLDCFGLRDLGSGVRNHNGIDYYHFTLRKGDPIRAADHGVIHEAGTSATNRDAGIHAGIHHDEGHSRYLHLDRLIVRRGDRVTRGQVIGYCGDTGSARAPHLHFEWRHYAIRPYNPTRPSIQQGTPVDPVPLLVYNDPLSPPIGDNMFVKQGDKGPVVEFWQRYLVSRGADLTFPGGPPQGIDGSYGPKTAAAVKAIIGGDGTSIGPEQAVAVLAGLADPVDFETVEVLRRVKR